MNFLIFLGSVRDSTPPRPARLGKRVALACEKYFTTNNHKIEIIDPLDMDTSKIFKPHFAYSKQSMPKHLDELANKIKSADGYIMISPEYNHSMSPALADILNHFGSSLFSYKPSAIVTYSAGQWGGARAAISMRAFLSELGCLPVSAMVHIPTAQDILNESGLFMKDKDAWNSYLGRTFLQLEWWANACADMKNKINPETLTPAMVVTPKQRNAP